MILARVIDIGVSVPDEAKDKIFSPLFTTKAKGTGLGLSVCKRNVEIHEGETAFKSEFGVGPTFTLIIPTHKEERNLKRINPTIASVEFERLGAKSVFELGYHDDLKWMLESLSTRGFSIVTTEVSKTQRQ